MFSNSLTRDMGLKVGPVMLGTFVKHYFDRVKASESADPDKLLRQDEILYDAAFNIIKSFLHESSFHTVEEIQGFSNTRTPSSPWTHLVRVLVPISSCDQAAVYLVQALGGLNKAREIVGGVKWWQVRGIEGVDGQWITAKKDWREAKRRHRTRESQRSATVAGTTPTQQLFEQHADYSVSTEDGTYEKYMDEMRCILYIHGGGYYFGSVDQERYSIQRHARKINGRVFAVNYRLAPQYPFPCGLQDVLAAYLYLIRPPPEADHCPIDPAHIVIAGDSAGGGMSLALLQVIRDTGLPAPGGGVLISPWCDLTHSFPSIHTNTETDIIPPTGLSFHKPSILWPPPPHDISSHVHASLRQKLRNTFRIDEHHGKAPEPSSKQLLVAHSGMPVNVGENIPVPPVTSAAQKLSLVTKTGEKLEIDEQIHFYTQNSLLVHPLVSPALSHLGGLPPLLFIASDKEVLRDEIIYTAHRAANPRKFSVKHQTKSLYPFPAGAEERYLKPTSVHLQVYDGTCHVLPVLFSFSTPAKFCFRSIASFIKFVTGMPLTPPISQSGFSIPAMDQDASYLETKFVVSPEPTEMQGPILCTQKQSSLMSASASGQNSSKGSPNSTPPLSRRQSLRRAIARANSVLRRQSDSTIREGFVEEGMDPPRNDSTTSSDVGGPRFGRRKSTKPIIPQERHAGDPAVYENVQDNTKFDMISVRVSTQGVMRPLESEADIGAFTVPEELIGTISELAIKRYMDGGAHFRKRFANTYKSIEKIRKKNLELVAKKERKHFEALRGYIPANGTIAGHSDLEKARQKVLNSPGWGYAWALDELENPPPSSIVARRDTEEARKLAEVADQAILGDTNALNANSLWSVMMNFLTVTPDRSSRGPGGGSEGLSGPSGELKTPEKSTKERVHRTFSQLLRRYNDEASS